MKTYPLYSASLEGKSYENGIEYELVIITKWSDHSPSATEVGHKALPQKKTRTLLPPRKSPF